MNDLAVITAVNEQATRQAQLDSVVASGKVALYEQTRGIVSIGSIEVYDTVAEARTAAAGRKGEWKVAS